ncbi:MAG: GspH/FimT family pseudopilin [Gammaproteobacteria bacterium]
MHNNKHLILSPHYAATTRKSGQSAFTLIELLTTLAITGIIAISAAPSLQNLLMDNRMVARVNDLMAHLNLARSEAIHRGARVVLCPSADQQNCAKHSAWHEGWIVFVDDNSDRKHGNKEMVLRLQSAVNDSFTIKSGSHQPVVFQPQGSSGGTNDTFTFCDARGPLKARAIVLSNSGRPRIAHNKSDGKPLTCI